MTSSLPFIEGSPLFIRTTRMALVLLGRHDPVRAALVSAHLRRITGLNHRHLRRVGRATLYGADRRAVTRAIDQAWIERGQRRCFITQSVWDVRPDDLTALRHYAGVLVHEAAHLYLETHDEAACNAEMAATSMLLTAS